MLKALFFSFAFLIKIKMFNEFCIFIILLKSKYFP